MLQLEEIKLELQSYEEKLKEMGASLDIASKSNEIEELEQKTTEPDFWDDPQKSQNILQKLKMLKDQIEKYKELSSKRDDLYTLCELSIEEQDESVITEIEEDFKVFKEDFENLKLQTLLTGPYDKKNAILTLHAGAGGTEAQDWVQMLLRMYTRWAEGKGFKVSMLDYIDGDEAGIKSVTIQVEGENAYGYLKAEKGVHRLVRISPFDSSGRRHTSFASLDVMPELSDEIEVEISPDDLRIDTYRSSGAGGQHVNKTESAVRITHLPTGLVAACQNERSQFQNKDIAMRMLKSKLIALKEREQKEKIEDLKGVQLEIAWGSQIRSYVFCPYTMVKDHRTNYEEGNVDSIMDGKLDGMINSYLSSISGK
ncbi:peptide chain release factor 2 [Herbivorax sp. ANBcel31]|uniref:peptide chain release factor 2 n=1 Tax=Herbivorax sp. ANBcel31 TaxID=3069754 RepID=UPI0027B77147|nr:peptide chain release factor 2 [Herbivorax sp. ANBcel31]MDQ2087406.1 peptide chain release factor 2 [Herbivorax sp. ANBcel31]